MRRGSSSRILAMKRRRAATAMPAAMPSKPRARLCGVRRVFALRGGGSAQQTALRFALKPLLCKGVMEKKVGMENPSAPVVETRQGALIGFTEGDTHVWCGIPYVAPPVGQWRWRSPRPPARWDGVRPATRSPPPAGRAAKAVRSWVAAIPASSLKTACTLTLVASRTRRSASGDGLAARRRIYPRRWRAASV